MLCVGCIKVIVWMRFNVDETRFLTSFVKQMEKQMDEKNEMTPELDFTEAHLLSLSFVHFYFSFFSMSGHERPPARSRRP